MPYTFTEPTGGFLPYAPAHVIFIHLSFFSVNKGIAQCGKIHIFCHFFTYSYFYFHTFLLKCSTKTQQELTYLEQSLC